MMGPQAQHVGPFKDSLEIKRRGTRPCDATVTIHLDWQPERFTVDPKLAEVIDIKVSGDKRLPALMTAQP